MTTIMPLLTRLGFDASGFEKGEKQAENSLSKLERRMAKMETVATGTAVATGAAFSAGFIKALDVSKGTAKLNAQLGTTGKTAEKISAVASKVFSNNFGDSMEQVNDGLKGVVQNFDGMREASSATLQDMTQRALTLATVMDEDVNKVTAAASQILKTGLARNAKEAFDVLQRGTELGLNKSEDLLDTFNEYSIQFKKVGLDAQTALGLMNQALRNGARDSDIAADAIKEFSLRAVDGSKGARDAYKALGLDADKMMAVFAKGGAPAQEALNTVFDRVRKLEGTTKQASVATGLFGTQFEDLGDALNAMDPSKAVATLGQVDGAVDKATKTMGETAASRIETFKRSVTTNFVNFIGDKVLPAVDKMMNGLEKVGIGPQIVTSVLMLAAAFGTTLFVVTKLAPAYQAAAAMLAKYAVGTRIQLALLKVWTLAQAAFNAVMAANPIALTIIAIIALIAIVVVAYKKFDWFKKLVDTVWNGIKAGAVILWNFLKMVWAGIISGLQSTAGFFKGLWSVVKVVWSGIQIAIGIAWKIIQGYFKAISFFIKTFLIPYFKLLLFVAKLVFFGIQVAVAIMWKIVQPIWKLFLIIIKVWWTGVKIQFSLFKAYITNVVIPVIKVLWNIAKWAFDQIASKAKWLWNNGIKPAFNAIKTGIGQVKSGFSTAVTAIGKIWDKLRSVVRKPVDFVLNTVYTKGIKGLWDKVAGIVKLPPMPAAPKFARGGFVRGPGGPRSDSITARLSNGEYVVNAKSTRRNLNLLHAINSGGPAMDIAKKAQLAGDPGFADGGIVGAVKGFFGKAKNMFIGGLVKAGKAALGPIIGAADRAIGGNKFGQMNIGLIKRNADAMLKIFKANEHKLGSTGVVKAARSQIGLPYSWGGGGKGGPSYGIGRGANTYGFDCSGLTEFAWWKGAKKSIGGVTYSQHPASKAISGPRPGALGFNSSLGHVVLASDKPGKVIEAPFTGGFVREVSKSMPDWRWPNSASMDSGYGTLEPGWNAIHNGTGSPEHIRRTSHGADMGGGLTVIVENHGVMANEQQLRTWFTGMYSELQRKNRVP